MRQVSEGEKRKASHVHFPLHIGEGLPCVPFMSDGSRSVVAVVIIIAYIFFPKIFGGYYHLRQGYVLNLMEKIPLTKHHIRPLICVFGF